MILKVGALPESQTINPNHQFTIKLIVFGIQNKKEAVGWIRCGWFFTLFTNDFFQPKLVNPWKFWSDFPKAEERISWMIRVLVIQSDLFGDG